MVVRRGWDYVNSYVGRQQASDYTFLTISGTDCECFSGREHYF